MWKFFSDEFQNIRKETGVLNLESESVKDKGRPMEKGKNFDKLKSSGKMYETEMVF